MSSGLDCNASVGVVIDDLPYNRDDELEEPPLTHKALEVGQQPLTLVVFPTVLAHGLASGVVPHGTPCNSRSGETSALTLHQSTGSAPLPEPPESSAPVTHRHDMDRGTAGTCRALYRPSSRSTAHTVQDHPLHDDRRLAGPQAVLRIGFAISEPRLAFVYILH